MTLARPPVVSQAEWDGALAAMTEREEAVAIAMHELAAARKRMLMVRVEHDDRFEGPDGRRSLPELFDGRSQLILYQFFFGSVWSMFSLAPYGGQSDDEDAPEGWPQAPWSFWYHRHDEFDEPPPSARGGDEADRDDRR